MSADERLQISISKKIEKKLQRDGSLARKELKILLLGEHACQLTGKNRTYGDYRFVI